MAEAQKLTFDRDLACEIAALVRQSVLTEREACAQEALSDTSLNMLQDFGMQQIALRVRQNIADAIRNRTR